MSTPALSVTIPPHLQRALEVMGRDMAVEPEALVTQAVFAWLRINGYVTPGTVGDVVGPSAAEDTPPRPAPAPTLAMEDDAAADEEDADDAPRQDEVEAPREPPEEDDGEDEAQAADEEAAAGDDAPDGGDREEDDDEAEGPAPADEDEDDEATRGGPQEDGRYDEPVHEGTFVVKSAPVMLFIEREGEEPVRMEADTFVIGRGPTCDLVIDSPRVSREHVRVSRQGVVFVLEDLGSSNGTWLGDDRVERREIEDGDELALGNEVVRFVLRAG
jgi:pSer/pThr/pTyr-binding forkhead associated (FHA) protein